MFLNNEILKTLIIISSEFRLKLIFTRLLFNKEAKKNFAILSISN